MASKRSHARANLRPSRFELYKRKRRWWWRFRAGNNRVVADGCEGYANRTDALQAIYLLCEQGPSAAVEELPPETP